MEFKIEKGIPMPLNRGKPRKYDLPLETMKVGDHVFISMAKTKIPQEIKIIRGFVLRYKHKTGTKFTVRKMENGIGIWKL